MAKSKAAVKAAVLGKVSAPEPVEEEAAAAEALKLEEEAAARVPVFVIAKGRSLTSKKGIRGPGEEVKPEYLAGGLKAMEMHFKSGCIVVKGE